MMKCKVCKGSYEKFTHPGCKVFVELWHMPMHGYKKRGHTPLPPSSVICGVSQKNLGVFCRKEGLL